MGSVLSKRKRNKNEESRGLKERIRFLEEEVTQIRCKTEHQGRAHEQRASEFMAKEAEWKRERKRWKEEVKRLRKKLQDKDERQRRLEEKMTTTQVMTKGDKEWQLIGANFLVEHMLEEQALREETVEKWKRLYLAIKAELDNLIHRTCQGERLWWGTEDEYMMEGLHKELKAKEATVVALKEQLLAMEKEGAKREREVDILRQSLRIMSSTKKTHIGKNLSRCLIFK
ncbi:uncharacterized protein LOC143845861 [Tasmannia lanceolata]|uniref:uncharacterized protein LOC143845861 n=1 Tax=Tasmannia lanceolata TaxID=3420 RepID=UPI0040642F8D